MQKHQHLSHRDICKGLLLFILLISLCGCSPSAKSEQEIVADLQKSPAFISEAVRIDSCEIIKRQTDPDNKCDLVYLTAYVNEDELKCALSYVMQYALYNDGWILENVSRYDDGPWSIGGLPIDRISSDAISSDFYFSDYALEITDCEILNDGDIYMGKEYEKWFEVALTASCSIFDYWATYDVGYQITGDGWICQYAIPNFSNYSPTYSPDINATNTIMDTLELGSGTSAVPYDSYEYIRAETDWGNCAETRYYEATKNWWFGKETYLVSIPLKFSLENGEDSTRWTYNKTAIESTLQSVDWDIEGWWITNYSDTDDDVRVSLEIDNIIATEVSNTFSVSLSCDAKHYHRHLFASLYDRCDTQGTVNATMRQTDPGVYSLDIDKPSEEPRGSNWNGEFHILGTGNQDNYGFYWVGQKLTMYWSKKSAIEDATEEIISTGNTFGLTSYDTSNPIYGMWKATDQNGNIQLFCFCPDGTAVYAFFVSTETFIKTTTYTYDKPHLTIGEGEWHLDWENDDLFSMVSLVRSDLFYSNVSRIPL